jgi:antitoxin component YwqK of YwqJK toxin-antitoxin module
MEESFRVPFSEIEHEEYTDARYRGEPFTGTAFYVQNGVVLEECDFVLGKLHGMRKEFFLNGSLKSVAQYENGREFGRAEEFYSDGKPRRIASYENGVLVQEQEFSENGVTTLHYDGHTNIKREWRLDGSLRKETVYGREISSGYREIEEERHFNHDGQPTVSRTQTGWVVTARGRTLS